MPRHWRCAHGHTWVGDLGALTFCPECGSAAVYEVRLPGQTLAGDAPPGPGQTFLQQPPAGPGQTFVQSPPADHSGKTFVQPQPAGPGQTFVQPPPVKAGDTFIQALDRGHAAPESPSN